MVEVVVIMSTFNGAAHIRVQLDSILSQKGVMISMLVRDDGSSDSTPEILDDYSHRHPGMFQIIRGQNIGWRDSFSHLCVRLPGDFHKDVSSHSQIRMTYGYQKNSQWP